MHHPDALEHFIFPFKSTTQEDLALMKAKVNQSI
jgi:hypothetical protein